jgi:hypothetical protein
MCYDLQPFAMTLRAVSVPITAQILKSARRREFDTVNVLRACATHLRPSRRCHLRAGFQQCKSFVEMGTVRCCPLWHPSHCPMGTVPRVLVRMTVSPEHTDFGGLSSGASSVVVRLDDVPLPPSSSMPTVAGCRLGGYPAGRDQLGGKRAAGGMSEDHDRCF